MYIRTKLGQNKNAIIWIFHSRCSVKNKKMLNKIKLFNVFKQRAVLLTSRFISMKIPDKNWFLFLNSTNFYTTYVQKVK